MSDEKSGRLDVGGNAIAYRKQEGATPCLVWLGGFRSDMTGTKAQTMVDTAARLGHASLRFDYSGHGESGGAFTHGTISRWVKEAAAVVRAQTAGPQILVGSSMGAWIALRLVGELAGDDRIAALLLIAPAPDFTMDLMEPAFSAEQRAALERDGQIEEPSEYSDEPTIITRALIEDGRANRVMKPGMRLGVPVRILQGSADPDVPPSHAKKLVSHLAQDDVSLTMVQGGDHRLSREADIALLTRTIEDMLRHP